MLLVSERIWQELMEKDFIYLLTPIVANTYFVFWLINASCILMRQKQKKNPELVDVAFNKLLYRFDI
jgi:hypothetical protein